MESSQVLNRGLIVTGTTLSELEGTVNGFGAFSISANGSPTTIATLKGLGKRPSQAVLGEEPMQVLLSERVEVEGFPGISISRFTRAVGSALIADLRLGAGGVSAKNDAAVLVNRPAGWRFLTREGEDAVGFPGAVFSAFTALDYGSGAVFTAKVKGPKIRANSNTGLWADTATGLRLICRTGQDVTIGGVQKRVKALAARLTSSNAEAFASACTPDGLVYYRVTFTDKTQAVMCFDANDPDAGSTVVAITGAAVPNLDDTVYTTLGLPNCGSGGAVAFQASVITGAGRTSLKRRVVVLNNEFHPETASASDSIVPTADPAVGTENAAVFLANLTGSAPKKVPAVVLLTSAGAEVTVRAGDPAPETGGAKFRRFLTPGLLPNRDQGVIFTGILALQKGLVTPKDQAGLWALDSQGDLKLLLRAGKPLAVNGAELDVRSFQLVATGGGKGDSVLASDGKVLCLVKFAGGSQQIVQFRVP